MALADMNPDKRHQPGSDKLCKVARVIADPIAVGLDAEDGPWLADQLDLDFRSSTAAALPYQTLAKMLADATREASCGTLYVSASLLGMHARLTCCCR